MDYQKGLSNKRESMRVEIRKKDKNALFEARRQNMMEHIEQKAHATKYTVDAAVNNLAYGTDISGSLESLCEVLSAPLDQGELYKSIMRMVDQGIAHIIVRLVKDRKELEGLTRLLCLMTCLPNKKTCRSIVNAGLIPFLVDLLRENTQNHELLTSTMIALGNIAIEDINFRDALVLNRLQDIVVSRIIHQTNFVCQTLYTEATLPLERRYWNFSWWCLQSLGEHGQMKTDPKPIIQLCLRFMQPMFPEPIIKFAICVLSDYAKQLQPYYQDLTKLCYDLINESSKCEKQYTRVVIHTVICIDGLTFKDLKPLYYLINPKYYSNIQTPSYQLGHPLKFLLCKVILNNVCHAQSDKQLRDQQFWSPLLQQASMSDQRAAIIKILTRVKLQVGTDEWAYRFITETLNEDSELNQMVATLDFISSQLAIKGKEYTKVMMEKHRIDVQLEVLQKKKNSAVYTKIERILSFYQ